MESNNPTITAQIKKQKYLIKKLIEKWEVLCTVGQELHMMQLGLQAWRAWFGRLGLPMGLVCSDGLLEALASRSGPSCELEDSSRPLGPCFDPHTSM